jgi:sortase A
VHARNVAGRLLIAGGALTMTWAAADWSCGALARDRARTAWEAHEARQAVVAAQRLPIDGERASRMRPPAGAPVARIAIPRLALDEVVVEGVDDDALRAGPGHVPGTPLPGASGNAVLSAHRDRHFRTLGELAVGDTIVTETLARRVVWVVSGRRVVHRDARVLRQGSAPELTLTTCWPIRWLGSAPDRLIITATPVVQLASSGS